MGSKPSFDGNLSRLKDSLGVESDADLARLLDIPASTVANWKSRGTVPLAVCVQAATERGVSLDWLILGKEKAVFDPDAAALAVEVIVDGARFLEAAAEAAKHQLVRGAFLKWYEEFRVALDKLDRAGLDRGQAIEKIRPMISQGLALAFIDVVELDLDQTEEG